MTGKHSPQEFEAEVVALKERVDATRREHLGALLPEVESLAEKLLAAIKQRLQALHCCKWIGAYVVRVKSHPLKRSFLPIIRRRIGRGAVLARQKFP